MEEERAGWLLDRKAVESVYTIRAMDMFAEVAVAQGIY